MKSINVIIGMMLFSLGPSNVQAEPTATAQGNKDLLRALDFNNKGYLNDVEIYAGLLNKELGSLKKTEQDIPNVSLDSLRKRAKAGKKVTTEDLGLALHPGDAPAFELPAAILFEVVEEHDAIAARCGSTTVYPFSKLDPKEFGLASPGATDAAGGSARVASYRSDHISVHLSRSVNDLVTGGKLPDQAAVFSYSKNVSTGHDQFGAQGTLSADYRFYHRTDDGTVPPSVYFSRIDFLPSVSFEKITGQSTASNNVDTLSSNLALQTDLNLPTPADNPDLIAFLSQTVALNYATDFELEQKVLGASYDGSLVIPDYYLGGLKRVGDNWFSAGFLLDLHLEGGGVLDTGKSTTLTNTETYFRVGPNVGLTLQGANTPPTKLFGGTYSFSPSDLTLTFTYQYYLQEVGESGDVGIFDVALEYAINSSPNLTWRTEYQNGKTDILLQRRNQFTTGLALKF